MLRFEIDDIKSQTNLIKHGISLETAQRLWEGPHVIIPAKNVSGEKRYAILGYIFEKIYIAIFTERKTSIRLISCHRADKKFERIFHEYLEKKN